jgi:hypothetical protein
VLVIVKDKCCVSFQKENSKIAAAAIDEKDWEIISEMFSAYRVGSLPVPRHLVLPVRSWVSCD